MNRGSASVGVVTGAIVACLGYLLADGSPALARGPNPSRHPYLHTVWTTEHGLPQNSVTAITQTPDGYLWLGTFGGLARFDGVKFTVDPARPLVVYSGARLTSPTISQRGQRVADQALRETYL
jgi:ligand-binding sensor domain-containing protein